MHLIIIFLFKIIFLIKQSSIDILLENNRNHKEQLYTVNNSIVKFRENRILYKFLSHLEFFNKIKLFAFEDEERKNFIKNFKNTIKEFLENKNYTKKQFIEIKNIYFNDECTPLKFSFNEKFLQSFQKLEQKKDIIDFLLFLKYKQILLLDFSTISILNFPKCTRLDLKSIYKELLIKEINLKNIQSQDNKNIFLYSKQFKKENNELNQSSNEVFNKTKKINSEFSKQQKNSIQKRSFLMFIKKQIEINNILKNIFNKQEKRINIIEFEKQRILFHTFQVEKIFSLLKKELKQLPNKSITRKKILYEISSLPEFINSQELDTYIKKLHFVQLKCKDRIVKIKKCLTNTEDTHSYLTIEQKKILENCLKDQKNILHLLLLNCNKQMIELNNLKIFDHKLKKIVKDFQELSNKNFFWISDIDPIDIHYPAFIYRDLKKFFRHNHLKNFITTFKIICNVLNTLFYIVCSLLLIFYNFFSYRHYRFFLENSSNFIGKVTQDKFFLTIKNIFWSILLACPIPICLMILSYGFRHIWPYQIIVVIGNNMYLISLMIYIFLINIYFAHKHGLFVIHFGWPLRKVKYALYYSSIFFSIIILLLILFSIFNNYDNHHYSETLGRLCFILLCICLTFMAKNLKRAGLPLYLNKHNSDKNNINLLLWSVITFIPIISIVLTYFGYFMIAQILLVRLAISLSVWFILLIVYYVIRRWMLIQRRHITFERIKKRRAEILSKRSRKKENSFESTLNTSTIETNEKVLNIDTISTKSLHLVRSILTLIASLSIIFLWSEPHIAFSFLKEIQLWNINSVDPGTNGIKPITIGSVLISILMFIITTQMVRNLPALLELILLQHLNLTPGTGYAITTLTRYALMFFGGLICFSLIGIEWSKLQWLIAALGVGLGFGLQEIFANFISGLMILFEKPIRIHDTVTIRNLTGNVTRINIRATTITDWNRKEIIVPNKAFITEQFINWSLSDKITRVVLRIPSSIDATTDQIINILIQSALQCNLVLKHPEPEAYLVNLEQGLQMFELRMYAAETRHRMSIRHQVHKFILSGYRENNLELPFPPLQITEKQNFFMNENIQIQTTKE